MGENTTKESGVEVEGTITEALSNGYFRVQLDPPTGAPNAQAPLVTAYIGGKMRTKFIRVVVGDRVRVELSPYDLTRGRITWLLSRRRSFSSDGEGSSAPPGPSRPSR
ncbi:MAG: translation initiation factor IF-1 [Chloroflexi bacterium]|nr:translation initiation factor IF-1 [Chloroflexota bacterium]